MHKLLLLFLPLIIAFSGCEPSNEELLSEARTSMGDGAFTEALILLDKSIKKDPENQTAYNMRGFVRLELGQTDLALDDFNRSVELDSSDYRAFYNRGNAYYQLQIFDKAVTNYDKALRLEPKNADVYINRGNALVQLEKYNQAILDYRFALKLDDSNYLTYFNLARTLYLIDQHDEAQLLFEKCLTIYQTFAPAHYFLGMIALEKNEPEASCLYFRQAADLGYQQAEEVLKIYCDNPG